MIVSALSGCASFPLSTGDYDSAVDARHTGMPGELRRGVPTFKTLAAALAAAPAYSTKPWRILVREGRYREKIVVDKPFISLVGEGREATVLSFDAFAGQARARGLGNWTTAGCATLTIQAKDFSAQDLTIENAFDFLANDAKDAKDPTRINDAQAVALMTATGADRTRLRNVRISGFQDTLFVNAGRSHFQKCLISGNVDFIFGAGQAVFEECDIVSRGRTKADVSPLGYITAPSTQISQAWGLVFLRCKLLKESPQIAAKSTPLGRPWHPTREFADGKYADPNAIGSSVFVDCFMDDHIADEGWAAMSGTARNGGAKVMFAPEDARFFEYHSSGPGAAPHDKRRQLTDAQAADFQLARLLGDWTR